MKKLIEVLTTTERFLREKGVPSPRLDSELLIGHVLGLDRVQVYVRHEQWVTALELEQLRELIRRRASREPIAWIIGRREFFGREFKIQSGVLVPRPDTETLVDAALVWIGEEEQFIADIGSGSGCVGISLALERAACKVYAVDLSAEALQNTKANVEKHGLEKRVAVLKSDLLGAIPASRPIDWVVSNPPYIPEQDIEGLAPEVRVHEPRLALDGGKDGLDIYRRLIPEAASRARKGVLVEVGYGQAQAVAELMRESGLGTVETVRDLSGIERVVRGRIAA
jgi:release factor glutamine methyltransferase